MVVVVESSGNRPIVLQCCSQLNQMKKLKAKKRALLSKLDGQEMDASLMDNGMCDRTN